MDKSFQRLGLESAQRGHYNKHKQRPRKLDDITGAESCQSQTAHQQGLHAAIAVSLHTKHYGEQLASQTMAKGRDLVERLLQREGKTALKLDELAVQLGFPAAAQLFEVVGKDEFSLRNIETLLNPPEPALTPDEIVLLKKSRGSNKTQPSSVLRIFRSHFGSEPCSLQRARTFFS